MAVFTKEEMKVRRAVVWYIKDNNRPGLIKKLADSAYKPDLLDEQAMIDIYGEYLWKDENKIDVFDEMRDVITTTFDKANKRIPNETAGQLSAMLHNLVKTRLNMDVLRKDSKSDTDVEREVFLMCVMFQQKDIATAFLPKSESPIAASLIACALSKESEKIAEEKDEYCRAECCKQMDEYFETIAAKTIEECYRKESDKAVHLLVRKLPSWNGSTLLSIADCLKAKKFMSTTACQVRLTQIWEGYFLHSNTSLWKFPIGVVAPVVLINESNSKGVPKKKSEGQQKKKDSKPLLKYSEDKWYPTAKDVFRKGYHTKYPKIIKPFTFFYNTPRTKMFSHGMSYLIYLCLFAYFINADLHRSTERTFSVLTYLIWTWSFALILDEIRELCTSHPQYNRPNVKHYFSSAWNMMDVTAHVLIITAVVLHLFLPEKQFIWVRHMYVVTFLLASLRMIHTFYASPTVGPLAVMVRRMLDDVWTFGFLLLIFVISYGVCLQALRYPYSAPSWAGVLNIVYYPYWSIFGETFSDDAGKVLATWEVENCTHNETLHRAAPDVNPRCPESSWMAELLLAGYMMITNVLLLNLLIAMFSNTYEQIKAESEKHWRYHRHQFVMEYYDKPALIPPLSILYNIYWFLPRICGIFPDDHPDTPFYRDLIRLEKEVEGYEGITYDQLTTFEQDMIQGPIDEALAKKTTENDFTEAMQTLDLIKQSTDKAVLEKLIEVSIKKQFDVFQQQIDGKLEALQHTLDQISQSLDQPVPEFVETRL